MSIGWVGVSNRNFQLMTNSEGIYNLLRYSKLISLMLKQKHYACLPILPLPLGRGFFLGVILLAGKSMHQWRFPRYDIHTICNLFFVGQRA